MKSYDVGVKIYSEIDGPEVLKVDSHRVKIVRKLDVLLRPYLRVFNESSFIILNYFQQPEFSIMK